MAALASSASPSTNTNDQHCGKNTGANCCVDQMINSMYIVKSPHDVLHQIWSLRTHHHYNRNNNRVEPLISKCSMLVKECWKMLQDRTNWFLGKCPANKFTNLSSNAIGDTQLPMPPVIMSPSNSLTDRRESIPCLGHQAQPVHQYTNTPIYHTSTPPGHCNMVTTRLTSHPAFNTTVHAGSGEPQLIVLLLYRATAPLPSGPGGFTNNSLNKYLTGNPLQHNLQNLPSGWWH